MISLPPIVLLLPFAVFMLGYVFFAFANVISLAKYGARNAVGLTASFIFVAGSAVILFMTWQALGPVDWFAAVPLAALPTSPF
jgi:uncharacterized membrane protein YfcA